MKSPATSVPGSQQAAIEAKEREFLKTVAAFFAVAPFLYGPFNAVLSIGTAIAFGARVEFWDGALFLRGEFLTYLVVYFLGLFLGHFWVVIYMPTLLTGAAFWLVAAYMRQRVDATVLWHFRIACAAAAALISLIVFFSFDLAFGTTNWAEPYFYRPSDSGYVGLLLGLNFREGLGPLFHLTTVCLTGFTLGFIFSPKATRTS